MMAESRLSKNGYYKNDTINSDTGAITVGGIAASIVMYDDMIENLKINTIYYYSSSSGNSMPTGYKINSVYFITSNGNTPWIKEFIKLTWFLKN